MTYLITRHKAGWVPLAIEIEFLKVDPRVEEPSQAHEGDAGYDLTSRVDVVLKPGDRALIPTGIAVSIPVGYAGFVQPRSGLASKHGISIVNTPGLIDSHYRGEIKVILINHDPNVPYTVHCDDKVCQLVFQKVEQVDFIEVERLDATARGAGGFGSTGF